MWALSLQDYENGDFAEGLHTMDIMKKGQKIAVQLHGEDLPTYGEVVDVKDRGQELLLVIKAARADGRIEYHEVVLIAGKIVQLAALPIWTKIGRFFKRLFTKKK